MFYVRGPISRNLLTMAGTGDYVSYLYLGGVLMTFARTAVDTIGNSLRVEMNRGTLESCWIAPISRFTMLTGRIIMNLIYVILANLFTAVLIHFAFQPTWHIDWTTILFIMFLALLSNYSFGILMGGIIIVFREAWSIFQIFTSILWILAGASFPIEILPSWAQSLSSIVPYYYSLRDFRAAVLRGATLFELTGDMLLLLVFSVVSLVLRCFVQENGKDCKARGDVGTLLRRNAYEANFVK